MPTPSSPIAAQNDASGRRAGMDPAREEARRWVRRKRTFYTVVVFYLAFVVLWFLIDILTGTDDWWFYWPPSARA